MHDPTYALTAPPAIVVRTGASGCYTTTLLRTEQELNRTLDELAINCSALGFFQMRWQVVKRSGA